MLKMSTLYQQDRIFSLRLRCVEKRKLLQLWDWPFIILHCLLFFPLSSLDHPGPPVSVPVSGGDVVVWGPLGSIEVPVITISS